MPYEYACTSTPCGACGQAWAALGNQEDEGCGYQRAGKGTGRRRGPPNHARVGHEAGLLRHGVGLRRLHLLGDRSDFAGGEAPRERRLRVAAREVGIGTSASARMPVAVLACRLTVTGPELPE